MGIFTTHTVTLKHTNGEIVKEHLAIKMDTVNLPFNMEAGGMDPSDWYDVITQGWVTPVPVRGDYFVDESTEERYILFSTVFKATNNLQFRVSKLPGTTP